MKDQALPTTPGDWYSDADGRVLAPDPLVPTVPWCVADVARHVGYADDHGPEQPAANCAVLVNAAGNYRTLREIVAMGSPLLDAPEGLVKPVGTLTAVLHSMVAAARAAVERTEGEA